MEKPELRKISVGREYIISDMDSEDFPFIAFKKEDLKARIEYILLEFKNDYKISELLSKANNLNEAYMRGVHSGLYLAEERIRRDFKEILGE